MGQWFLKRAWSEESGHFITLEKKKPKFLRRLSVPVTNICVRYYAVPFNILTVRTRFKGRVLRRKSFHNSSHQASERNCVLYRTYRPPYHISHNLKKVGTAFGRITVYFTFLLFYFVQCLLLRFFLNECRLQEIENKIYNF